MPYGVCHVERDDFPPQRTTEIRERTARSVEERTARIDFFQNHPRTTATEIVSFISLYYKKITQNTEKINSQLTLLYFSHSYLRMLTSTVLPIVGATVTFTSGVLTDRTMASTVDIALPFALTLGVFVFYFASDVSEKRPVDSIIDAMTISAFVQALAKKEEPFIGLIVMTSQGSGVLEHVEGHMKPHSEYLPRRTYVRTVCGYLISTSFFKGLVPFAYLISTVAQEKEMTSQVSSVSIGFFYMFLIFFSFVNGWSLCTATSAFRKLDRRPEGQPAAPLPSRSSPPPPSYEEAMGIV